MFKKINVDSIITSDPKVIINADKLVLPGVGSFDYGMINLRKLKLEDAIKTSVIELKKPILGICLGMQLLGNGSEEGVENGLELIDMNFMKFNFEDTNQYKIPHMGWNSIDITNKVKLTDLKILNPRFYFVHSYYAVCKHKENVIMTANYGFEFAVAVQKDNIYGVQFHPEKSHKFGMELLKNFSEI